MDALPQGPGRRRTSDHTFYHTGNNEAGIEVVAQKKTMGATVRPELQIADEHYKDSKAIRRAVGEALAALPRSHG